jgi:predicted HicB family RNase H-like nuclease
MKHKTSLMLDGELVRALRVKAALTGTSLTTAFEEAIKQYVGDKPIPPELIEKFGGVQKEK